MTPLKISKKKKKKGNLKCICEYETLLGNKGNILFNDTLNTFYLWLYSVR